ncbi:MAG TPA: hypothetical protein G4O16_06970 [Dehalococcoidia bacterium]|nr:hypothetical protein [Dehalococcoidia bacterium]
MVPDRNEKSRLNLLRAVVNRSRLPWYLFTALLTVTLLVLLIITTVLDGMTAEFSRWDFWREYVAGPVLIAYIFLIFPYMQHLSEKTTDAFRQLQPHEGTQPDREKASIPHRGREWVALAIGALFWILITRPWDWRWVDEGLWLYLYTLISASLLFGLLGWLIYYAIIESHHIHRLSRQELKLDIFDTSALIPIARSSLGTSFAFIGGISISLIFQTVDSLLTWQNITIYAVLVFATLLIFFFSLWSTHRIMAMTKNNELSIASSQLEEAIRKLRDSTIHKSIEDSSSLHSAVAAWGTYESRVRETSEWPFNANILRRLAASVLVPVLVYLIKVLVGTRFF